jgi:hypothetical protein
MLSNFDFQRIDPAIAVVDLQAVLPLQAVVRRRAEDGVLDALAVEMGERHVEHALFTQSRFTSKELFLWANSEVEKLYGLYISFSNSS